MSSDASLKVDEHLEKLEKDIQDLLLQDPKHVDNGNDLSVSSEKRGKRRSRAKSIRKGLGKLLSRSSSKLDGASVYSDAVSLDMAQASTTTYLTSEPTGGSHASPTDLATELTDHSSRQSSEDVTDDLAEVSQEEASLNPFPNKYQGEATLEAATFDIEAFVLAASKSDLEIRTSASAEPSVPSVKSAHGDSDEDLNETQSNISVEDRHEDDEKTENLDQNDEVENSIGNEKSDKVLRSFFSSWIVKSSKKNQRPRRSLLGRKSSSSTEMDVDDSRDAIESVEACRDILSSVSFSREEKEMVEYSAQRESLETNHEKAMKAKIEHIYNTFRTQKQKRTQLKYAVFSWLLKNGTTLYARGGGSSSSDSSAASDKDESDRRMITKLRPNTEQDVLDAGLKVVQMRVEDLCRALNIRSKQQMSGFKTLLLERLKRLEQSGHAIGQDRQLMVSNGSLSAESTMLSASFLDSKSDVEDAKTSESASTSLMNSDTAVANHEVPMAGLQSLLITKASSDDAEGFNVVYDACTKLCAEYVAVGAAKEVAQDGPSSTRQEEIHSVDDNSSNILQSFSEVDEEGDAALVDALVQLFSTSQEESMGKEVQLAAAASSLDQKEATNSDEQNPQQAERRNTENCIGETQSPDAEEIVVATVEAQEKRREGDSTGFGFSSTMENFNAVQSSMIDSLFSLFCTSQPKALPSAIVRTPDASFDATQEGSAKEEGENKLEDSTAVESKECPSAPTSPRMMPIVPFQKSPSDFLQARNQSRLDLQVRRSSSAPSRRIARTVDQVPGCDEEEILVHQMKKDETTTESEVLEISATKDNDADDTPSLSVLDGIPGAQTHVPVVNEISTTQDIAGSKKQQSKRKKRSKRSKRKSSRNLLGRSFLAPITEHAEENVSKASEDSSDKPTEKFDGPGEPLITQQNDEVALVVSYKLEDATFTSFDGKSTTTSLSQYSEGLCESDEVLQELTKSSSEDPKLFLSSEDAQSSYDSDSLSKPSSEDCDSIQEDRENASASLSSNGTGSGEDRTLESVDLSHTITQSTGSTYSARTNSLGSSHSSGTNNGDRQNSFGSSQSSETDNGESVWSPFGLRSESSSETREDDFGSSSRTFESTIASECNDESYDDETLERHSTEESLEESTKAEDHEDRVERDSGDAPFEVENPIKQVIRVSQLQPDQTQTTIPASPRKRASRGNFFKSQSKFGRKCRKNLDCTIEADIGSVGHTVLEVYIPEEAETSKEGTRLRIPSPKKIATMLRRKSKKSKTKSKPSFLPPSSAPSKQGRDDEDVLRGQSTIDSREMESRDMEVNTMIPMPQSLSQFYLK